MKCGRCGCGFCGFCFQDCGDDAHQHCATVHGAYRFPYDVYQRNFGARAAQEIRALLGQANPELREALSALIPAILKHNQFFITPQQILDNPRQDAPRQQGVRIESAALLCEVLNCSGYAAAALFHDNNNVDWKEEVFGPLQANVEQLARLVLPQADDEASTFFWCSAAFARLRNGVQPAVQTRQTYVAPFEAFVQENAQTQLGLYIARCAASVGVISELRYTPEYAAAHPDPHRRIFLPRSLFTKHQFESEIETNAQLVPVLHSLTVRVSSCVPQSVVPNLRLMHFIRDLESAVTQCGLNYSQASRMTLDAFIKQHAPLLASRLACFKDDFLKVFPKIVRYQCKVIKELGLEHLRQGIPENAPLVLFLPADNGPGVLAKALWEGREGDQAHQWTALGNLQAEVLRAVGNSGQEVNLGANNVRIVPAEREASPFDVRSSEIISCEFDTVFDLFYKLFLIPGEARVSNDLHIMDELCKYGKMRLAFCTPLLTSIPEYHYDLDGLKELLQPTLNQLMSRGRSCELLPVSVIAALRELRERAPNAIRSIFAFSIAAARQLGERHGDVARRASERAVRDEADTRADARGTSLPAKSRRFAHLVKFSICTLCSATHGMGALMTVRTSPSTILLTSTSSPWSPSHDAQSITI